MRVLVAGSKQVDAGKTTFSSGLLARTGAHGFKPRAGNDYWFDHDDYLAAVTGGRLYGKDAKRLAAASPGDPEPEAINPLHRLWRPSPGTGKGMLGRDDREFIVDRVGSDWVVNGTVSVPPEAEEFLPLDEATVVESLPALNTVMDRLHLPALETLARTIRSRDPVVIESYGDVARPIRDLAVDAVAVVEPGRMRAYPGDRFGKACEVASGSGVRPTEGSLETVVPDVIELLEPKATASLPALASEVQADPAAVADAYEEAYDALLSLV